VGLILINFASAWAQDADEYIHKGLALHDQLKNHPLITTAFAPHAPYTVSDTPLQRIATLAEELDISIHMHIHETAFEVEDATRQQGQRPLARLQQLGLVSPRLLGVHMTQLNAEEISAYATAGAHVVHCPESNLKLASGFCPVDTLLKAGVNVALGTDGAASNDDLDMLGEMRTAALIGKAVANDATALSAETVLRMATINGARALGLEHKIGSLEVGKAADVIAINLQGIETEPLYNPLSQLVYATGRERVTDVWVAGQQLLKERQLTTLDEQQILTRARQWQDRLQETGV
ncbi:MAG: amidohydrolase family protein, partial [Gammaproteobacteria bacterium]